MKKYILIFILLFYVSTLYSQEYIFKFKVNSKKELNTLTNIISIDNYKNGEVTAYANSKEFETFKALGYKYEFLPHPSFGKALTMAATVEEMANWDRYPTYDVYIEMMNKFATDYPTLCQVVNIGLSEQGRELIAVKISDNVTTHEAEPEFFYTGTMHGDETAGFTLSLRLIDYLLSNYGTDTEVTELVDGIEIYINPAANPDGTYNGGNTTVSGATRSNSNGVDLNRDFPDPVEGANAPYAIETQAMMNFADLHHFVMSANFHGGAEVYNYPWDVWTSSVNPHADADWWEELGTNYVASARILNSSYMTDVTADGVTEGADWYPINGGRQDYMNYFEHCREFTLEISSTKSPSAETLPDYWNYNKQAMLDYIKETKYGFNGTVKNLNDDPLDAKIEISVHDADNSWVTTDPANGDYYRPIEPGTYDVTYSSFGYTSQNQSVTLSDWGTTIIKNIILETSPNANTITGIVNEEANGNPIDNVRIEILDVATNPVFTDIDGSYIKDAIEDGTYQVKASKDEYLSDTLTIIMNGNDEILNFSLKSISNTTNLGNNNINIYPNPNSGYFFVKSDDLILNIKITDISGKTISDKKLNNYSTHIKNMELGFFLLEIRTINQIIYKKVVIK